MAYRLGYQHFSSGDLYRKMAEGRGLTVEELNYAAEKQRKIDLDVDELIKRIGREKVNLVMDSRMAFHWIPESFKVFLDLDPKTAAERTFAHIQKEGRTSQTASSIDEVLKKTIERRESEQKRYQRLYSADINDKTQFDILIDTGVHDLEAVIKIVIAAYQRWLL